MTDLEQSQHDAILLARDYLSAGESRRKCNYMLVMDSIRMAIKRFDNRRFGCGTGLHSGACTCVPARLGVSIECSYLKVPRLK